MDTLTTLFIRACKSKEPTIRLRSIYRRFFVDGIPDDLMWACIASRLADICDKYWTDNASYLVQEMFPSNEWRYKDGDSNEPLPYNQKVVRILVNRIRFTHVDRFPDLKKAARYRRLCASDSSVEKG